MLPPFMLEQLVFLPETVSSLLIILLVLGGIVEYRQGHISRPAIVGNAFLLWQVFYPHWKDLPDLLQWYLNAGTVVALIASGSYLLRERLPKEFYTISYVLYGSISVLVVIAWWMRTFSLVAAVLPSIFFVAGVLLFIRVITGPTRRRRHR